MTDFSSDELKIIMKEKVIAIRHLPFEAWIALKVKAAKEGMLLETWVRNLLVKEAERKEPEYAQDPTNAH